ncbi:MAG: queuosine precursor transporter [Methanosphaera sp.]|uniref:queuosine precursor transporter n=1 Tax=Methanosphaera sp. TaxID=2666342 RepID=UPI0025F0E397|nr:queuosine precursor transporter [Methanosphaera sp.]MCI5866587.1 queuosine precursor transporter [Methanosphaera sp.]MDD6535066.1 queuosine precursor transporter [Methanosphaera sp.]MDY3955498.1 queuosine precursor transporter [Methanosphaera sp.]
MNFKLSAVEKRIVIGTIFCISFITANIITIKLINLEFIHLMIPAGILIYPLVFVLTSVMTEAYGERVAQRTLIMGIFANLFFLLMVMLVAYLPPPSGYIGDEHLRFVFGAAPRFFVAGIAGYFSGNLVNARLTSILVARSGGSDSSLKNLFAISIGILVDIIVFIGVSYIGIIPIATIAYMVFNYWIINVVWVIIAKPLVSWTLKWAKS